MGTLIYIVGVMVVVLTLAVAVLYLFPLGSDRLQQGKSETLAFTDATSVGRRAVQRDGYNPRVLRECRTQLLTHANKTAKAVLMLHGYTGCPGDYSGLAQLFYERGYNVYVPREPHHGLADVKEASRVSSAGLVDYADDGMNVVAALGDEVGVIGESGGAALATWLAQYRSDSVAHLLALAPLYQPDSAQAPGFAIKPLTVLFGQRLLPDRQVSGTDFTLSGLAQYLRIVRNYRDEPTNPKLRSVGVVFSTEDPYIDRGFAADIPTRIAEANELKVRVHEFGPELKVGHNILDPVLLGSRTREIEELYFEMYEG